MIELGTLRLALVVAVPMLVAAQIGGAAAAIGPSVTAVRELLARGEDRAADSLATQLARRVAGRQRSRNTLLMLDSLTAAFEARSNFAVAARYSELLVGLGEWHHRDDPAALAAACARHAVNCERAQRRAEADRYGARAIEIGERTAGFDSLVLADYVTELGRIRRNSGELEQALASFERAIEIRRRVARGSPLPLAQALRLMGSTQRDLGRFAEAARSMASAREIADSLPASDRLAAVDVYNAYAALLGTIGDSEKALGLFLRCVEITARAHGTEHYDVARYLNNVGVMLASMGRVEEARAYHDSARVIREKIEDVGGVAESLYHLGNLYAEAGELERARAVLERCVDLRRGWSRPAGIASALRAVGRVLHRMGDLAGADSCFASAEALLSGTFFPSAIADLKADVARLRYTQRDTSGALSAALAADSLAREALVLAIQALSERQSLLYSTFSRPGYGLALSLAAPSLPGDQIARIWDMIIQRRALVLDEMAVRNRIFSLSADPAVRQLRDSLTSCRRRLARHAALGPRSDARAHATELDSLRRERERVEERLAERSSQYRNDLARRRAGFASVSAALPPRSALVAFVQFQHLRARESRRSSEARPDESRDSISTLLAFVLRSSRGNPTVVALGPATRIDSLVERWRAEVSQPPRTPFDRARSEARAAAAGLALRAAAWDPVTRLLGDASRVFIVPDGSLQLVNFAALPVSGSRFLVEAGPLLHVLSSERDLVVQGASGHRGGLLALAGPDFEHAEPDPGSMAAIDGPMSRRTAATWPAYRGPLSGCDDFSTLVFPPLPAAEREAEDVAAAWDTASAARAGVGGMEPATRITGPTASESAFKHLAPGRGIIHVATHGFFLEERCSPAPGSADLAESPLLRSGMALAGANRRGEASGDAEDGILTADEIATLDLSRAEWVVLSACNTGLGDVHVGEGVFGLRRALAVAGARTTIMSLWRVEDSAAREWMRALYQARLVSDLGTAESVRRASQVVLTRRRARGESTHPSSWAAFIAAGDWR